VKPRAIGAIRIDERHTLVEVESAIADDVIEALRKVHIKGKRLPVHRARSGPDAGRPQRRGR
jgi:hypothetical protein